MVRGRVRVRVRVRAENERMKECKNKRGIIWSSVLTGAFFSFLRGINFQSNQMIVRSSYIKRTATNTAPNQSVH